MSAMRMRMRYGGQQLIVFAHEIEKQRGLMVQLRWQRLRPFEKLADMLLNHLEGILNYCRTKVPLGMVEAINANIKSLLRRGRGYKNLRYLLLKAQRMAATRTEFVAFRRAA